MKVLALDTSIVKMGFSIVEEGRIKDYGIIKPKSTGENRFKEIYQDLKLLVTTEKPDVIVAESQYMPTGYIANSIGKTMEVLGIIRAVAFSSNIYFESIHPKTVKSALGLSNKAKRKEAKEASLFYANTFPGVNTKSDDVADAIVIGWVYYQENIKKV